MPTWVISLTYLLATIRVLPFALFLFQYRGNFSQPIPLMLRGFAFTGFLQAATSLIILIQNPNLSSLRLTGAVLYISVGNQLLTTVVAWYLYYVFSRFRKKT